MTDGLEPRQILFAGDYLGLLAEEMVAICLLSGLLGCCLGAGVDFAAQTKGIAMIGFSAAGLVGPYLQLSTLADTRRQRIARGLPYAVDAMTLAMSAGLDFPGAIRRFELDNGLPLTGRPEDRVVNRLVSIGAMEAI